MGRLNLIANKLWLSPYGTLRAGGLRGRARYRRATKATAGTTTPGTGSISGLYYAARYRRL